MREVEPLRRRRWQDGLGQMLKISKQKVPPRKLTSWFRFYVATKDFTVDWHTDWQAVQGTHR